MPRAPQRLQLPAWCYALLALSALQGARAPRTEHGSIAPTDVFLESEVITLPVRRLGQIAEKRVITYTHFVHGIVASPDALVRFRPSLNADLPNAYTQAQVQALDTVTYSTTERRLQDETQPKTTTVSPGAGTLRAAVEAANPGDTLVLENGVYTVDEDLEVVSILGIPEKVLQGAVLQLTKQLTVKAATPGGATIDAENKRLAVYIDATASVERMPIRLEGLVMKNGNGKAVVTSPYGGGVYINTGEVTFQGCTIRDNRADDHLGGGVIMYGATVEFISTTITNNEAPYGGGVYIAGGTVTFDQSTITDNTASVWGGGVFISSGDVTFRKCTVSGNTA